MLEKVSQIHKTYLLDQQLFCWRHFCKTEVVQNTDLNILALYTFLLLPVSVASLVDNSAYIKAIHDIMRVSAFFVLTKSRGQCTLPSLSKTVTYLKDYFFLAKKDKLLKC